MDQIFKVDALTGTRRLFYAVTPNETSFQTLEEVPPYIVEASPFFVISVILEEIILCLKDRGKDDRFADSITSMTSGMFLLVTGIFTKTLELGGYIYVYENFRLYDLPWDSPWTWLICFLGIDLGYYWFHRMSHEVNIMWGAHQVHHSSEEYNLTTALRQSIFQRCFSWAFYIPLAFFAPPSSMLVHSQFNTIYQFWIHTELIRDLGPLEYILNTPSHHRVHHGRNRYCIDKNYAGTLIIWDRMFGTFEAESDPVAYGLTHPITTYHPFEVQLCHLKYMWTTFWSMPGIWNKICVIINGPGWAPGKPRTGLIEDIPDVCGPELNKYRTPIPRWLKAYISVHFLINLLLVNLYLSAYKGLSQLHAILGMTYNIFTFTCIGMLCDLRPWWNVLAEMARCAGVFAVTSLAIHNKVEPVEAYFIVQVIFALSLLFWLLRVGSVQETAKQKAS
ncbi:alkylglycerol monooxygenase-like [Diadema antillarum]|uniref:alkylglycerol monooxygenase-like n=1 Tax=Diadema antillarum TaxID=105358 RepID=UPI003A8C77F2